MVLVAACGVAAAALRSLSDLVFSVLFTLAMTMILFGLVAAFVGYGRTFWVGFVIVGGGYAFLAFGLQTWYGHPHYTLNPEYGHAHYLVTTDLLDALYERIHPQPQSSPPVESIDREALIAPDVAAPAPAPPPAPPPPAPDLDLDTFQRIGHALAIFAHGITGGLLALFLERKVRRPAGATGP